MSASNDFLNIVLPLLAAPVATMASAALWKLYARFDKQATAQDRTNMEGEVAVAINAGIAMVEQVVPDARAQGLASGKVRDDILSAAATYMRQRFPDRAAQISAAADNGTRLQDVHAAVQQTLAARLTNVISQTPLVATAVGGLQPVPIPAATTLAAPLANAAPPPPG